MAVVKRLGKTIDGVTITVFLGTTKAELSKIEYSDKLTTEVSRRLGQQGIAGRSLGIYEPGDVSIEVEEIVWRADILGKLPTNGFGDYPFTVVVSGTDPDPNPASSWGTFTDTLQQVRIGEVKHSFTSEAGVSMVSITLTTNQILLEGKSINYRQNAPRGGTANTMRL